MSGGVFVTVEGAGEPVLLLHGQPGSAADWAGVRRELGERFRVLTPDRPGYGRTGGEATGLGGNAEAMARLLEEQGIASAVVAGHSWGAAVALAMAERYPALVRRLVLVCPVTPDERFGFVDRMLARPRTGAAVVHAGFRLAGLALSTRPAQLRVERLLPGFGSEATAGLAREWRRGSLWRSFHLEQQALFEELPSLRAGVDALDVEALVVIGAADHVTSPSGARRLAEALRARVIEVPRLGHMLPMQSPRVVAEAIADG